MGTKKETIVLTLETRKTVKSHNGMTNDTDGSAFLPSCTSPFQIWIPSQPNVIGKPAVLVAPGAPPEHSSGACIAMQHRHGTAAAPSPRTRRRLGAPGRCRRVSPLARDVGAWTRAWGRGRGDAQPLPPRTRRGGDPVRSGRWRGDAGKGAGAAPGHEDARTGAWGRGDAGAKVGGGSETQGRREDGAGWSGTEAPGGSVRGDGGAPGRPSQRRHTTAAGEAGTTAAETSAARGNHDRRER